MNFNMISLLRILSSIALSVLLGSCAGSGGGPPGAGASTSSSSSSSTSSSTSSGAITSVSSRWPVAFVLPYDDSSDGVTHFGNRLNHTPAGALGSVGVNSGGHFEVGGERIRFWGVNITGRSAFPGHADAEKVAARLGKFGVNVVRFHHMENNWGGPSLIDYSQGNSRNLHVSNLEKLDYFVAQLKAQGIYTNFNLLTSREYMPADGLPAEITQLNWKQRHILGYILPAQRALEKEHAASLLTHVNPYTGLSYAADPAVAFVEVNNENSIYQQYFEGSVDDWPEALLVPLRSGWNDWLATQYADTATLESGWGVVDEALGAEMLANGNFSGGLSNWNLEEHESAQASGVAGTYDGRAGLRINISQTGSAGWHVQVNQSGLDFSEDQIYTLTFWAKADNHDDISAAIQQAYNPWGTFESNMYSLSNVWQEYTLTFIADFTDDNIRVNFGDMGLTAGNVYLADVSLRPGGSLGELPAGQTLEAGNIEINRRSDRYTEGRAHDWMRFLLTLEQDYWGDIRDYLKNDLEFQGLTAGTIVSLSPPSVQQQFDLVDGHAYWHHPVFPGEDWDPVNWTVQNSSMVNSTDNTLHALSNLKVAGKPYTVSEYQHTMPNSYAAEAALLIAAYGALQDWDGVYLFTYEADGNGAWNSDYFSGFFQTNFNPSAMANLAVAANLFRRLDVAAAQELVRLNFAPATELDLIRSRGASWSVSGGQQLDTPAGTGLVHRLALDTAATPTGVDSAPVLSNISLLQSDTGQLQWDRSDASAGIVSIDTERSKGVLGYIEGRRFELGEIALEVGQLQLGWATLSITAQSGSLDEYTSPATLLAVATGRTENTDMQWKDASHTSVGSNWGRAPTLIEVVPFALELPVAPSRVRAWALNETGQRAVELTVEPVAGGSRVVADGSADTLWYEISVAAE
jgi:hypothetical protein